MPTVAEILRNAGLSDYEINSLDDRTTQAFGQVLSEAELQKQSVDSFWANTYAPGIQQWETEKQALAQRLAAAEGRAAAAERERQVLAESGVITDSSSQSRNSAGQYVTPGTPSFSNVDANDLVSRVATGIGTVLDVSHRYQQIYGKPLPVNPSVLISEADSLGISPAELAERKFQLTKKEQEQQIQKIRDEERAKVAKEYGEKFGPNPDIAVPRGSSGFSDIQRAVKTGERKDPLKLDAAGRRQQALQAIHRAVEERQQRDA